MIRFVFIAGGIFLLANWGAANINRSTDIHEIKKEPERICSGTGDSCKYMIYTDEQTYQNVDSVWHLKFNSSDMHGQITPGRTCRITSVGFRVTFLSWYKNAIKVECA